MQPAWRDRYGNRGGIILHYQMFRYFLTFFCFRLTLKLLFIMQKEYMSAKPAREAAAKAKLEAEALLTVEIPIHADNEWNIRYFIMTIHLTINASLAV